MEEILGRIEERQRDHDRRKAEHQGQHHLGEDEDDAGHETKKAQKHQAYAAEDSSGHPVQVVADRVQVLAELRDQPIEFARKVGSPCPAAADRRDQGPCDIVEPADHSVGDRVEVGPIEREEAYQCQLDQAPEEAGPIHAAELEGHVDADADQRKRDHQQDDRAGIARHGPELGLGRIGEEAVGGSNHPADDAHYQLPCASQISWTARAIWFCSLRRANWA